MSHTPGLRRPVPAGRKLVHFQFAREGTKAMKFMIEWKISSSSYKATIEAFGLSPVPSRHVAQGMTSLGRWHSPGSVRGWHLVEGDPVAIADHVAQWAPLAELEITPVLEDEDAAKGLSAVFGQYVAQPGLPQRLLALALDHPGARLCRAALQLCCKVRVPESGHGRWSLSRRPCAIGARRHGTAVRHVGGDPAFFPAAVTPAAQPRQRFAPSSTRGGRLGSR